MLTVVEQYVFKMLSFGFETLRWNILKHYGELAIGKSPWSTTLCWMSNHVSIRRCFKSDKVVLSFQFYKECQTGRWWDNPVCILVPKIAIIQHNFASYCTNKKGAIFYVLWNSYVLLHLLFWQFQRSQMLEYLQLSKHLNQTPSATYIFLPPHACKHRCKDIKACFQRLSMVPTTLKNSLLPDFSGQNEWFSVTNFFTCDTK